MEKRKLGNQGLEVSTIGLGCMGMTQSYPPFPQKKDMIKLIHEAIDLGVNFFDTAEGYGPYENEKLLGKAIKGHRENVVIATKFGFDFTGNNVGKSGKFISLDSRPKTIKRAVDGMLKRLNTDYIDLLYQHRVDPNVPIPGTKKLERLKENIGACNVIFTKEELNELNNEISKINIVGERYPEDQEKLTGI